MTVRTIPSPLYGVTIDNAAGAGKAKIAAYVDALGGLAHMPTVRIVFDPGQPPLAYAAVIEALRPVAYIVGELVDSSSVKKTTFAQYHAQVENFVAAFGSLIDVYEIGNEVSGNWLGPYADVAAKVADAFDVVHAAGLASMITLYYNDGCGDGPGELDPIAWTDRFLPDRVRLGVAYATVSYYEGDCREIRPTPATFTKFFATLSGRYPQARVGFGEIGLPNRVRAATLATAEDLAVYYYGLGLLVPAYMGGGFWWYFAEDAVPISKPMWQILATAMR